MSRVMLIGGAGLLGTFLTPLLESVGYEVGVFDDMSGSVTYRRKRDENVYFGDATEYHVVKTHLGKFRPDILFVCLDYSFPLGEGMYRFQDDASVVLNSANALAANIDSSIQHVYFCSTHDVYGGPDARKPVKESRKITECSSYFGTSKLAAEQLLSFRCSELNIPFCCLRIFNMYGPRTKFNHKNGIVSFMIHTLLSGDEVLGVPDPDKKQDFVHVSDVASASQILIDNEYTGTVNVGSGQAVTLREIGTSLTKLIDPTYKPVYLGANTKNPKFSRVADVEKLKALGWELKAELFEELPELVEFRKRENELLKDPAEVLRLMRER